jgi:hypothetical protein
MQQTDVKSAHLNAAGSLYTGRARIKGVIIAPAVSTAVAIQLRDGGATGPIVLEIDSPSNSNPNSYYVAVPGEGILCASTIHLTLSAAITGITIFYG